MKNEIFFPLTPASQKPANTHDPLPFGQELHQSISVTLVAGVDSVDVESAFGKDVGSVYGIIPLGTKGAGANEVLAFKAVASSTTGKVTVSVDSSDASATDTLSVSFWLLGKAMPVDA